MDSIDHSQTIDHNCTTILIQSEHLLVVVSLASLTIFFNRFNRTRYPISWIAFASYQLDKCA